MMFTELLSAGGQLQSDRSVAVLGGAPAPDTSRASNRLRVQHVITGLNYGGAEILLARLLATLSKEQAENRVLSLLPPGPVTPTIERLPVPVSSLGMSRALPRLGHLQRLFRYTRSMPPLPVLQGWMYHGNLAATALHFMQPKSRLLWSIHHSIDDLGKEKPLSRYLIRLAARLSSRAEAIVYVSEASARQHEAIGFDPDRRIVIPNGVDVDLFRPRQDSADLLRHVARVTPGRRIVGAIGRNHPMKDHPRLIRAAAQAIGQGADMQLVFIGDGVSGTEPTIARALQETGIGDRVSFLGARDDIPLLMPGFDLFVSSSAFGESCPVVLLEAMASAVPCVATDLGDCRRILGPGASIVPPSDTRALAAAISQWVGRTDEELRSAGDAARNRVIANYTLDTMVGNYRCLWLSSPARREHADR